MTGPSLPDGVGKSTQKGVPEPTNEHHASLDKPSIEDQNMESTSANQPQDGKSPQGREPHLVKNEVASSGSHEPQDDGNTNMVAEVAVPGRRSSLLRSQPPAPGETQTNERFLQAARKGDWKVMSTEIQSGADLSAKTSFLEETALHLACRLGYHTVLQNLLEQKPILNNLASLMKAKDINGWTLLHSACSHNETGLNRFYEMMSENFDDDISRMPQSPSHAKAESTRKTLDILFDSPAATKFNIDARDKDGKTALHMACNYSSAMVVKSLVNNGASVNVKDNFNNTPLTEACQYQSFDVIDFLLNKNAKVNANNKHKSSPLTVACEWQKEALSIKRLLDAGADCNWTDNDRDSPLILASRLGNTAMIREILKRKPTNLNKQNKKGESALSCAISRKEAWDELVPLLLNSGCTLDEQNASMLFPRRTTESFSESDLQQSIWLKILNGMLSVRNQPIGTDLSVTIKPLLKYASNEEKVFAVLRADTDANFEILNKATKGLGLRKNICSLIRDIESNTAPGRSEEEIRQMIWYEFLDEYRKGLHQSLEFEYIPSTLLQFSALHGDYMLVWYLLKTSQSRKEKDIESAMKIAKGPDAGALQGKPSARDKTDSRKPHHDRDSKSYKLTINMLQNAAAIMSMSKQLAKKLPTRPKTEDMQDKKSSLQRHHATVIDFYKRGGREDGPIDLLRASPSVFDLIYASEDSKVDGIMKTAKTTFNEMMDWMEHLTERVYSEKTENKKWSSFYDLAQRSRIELPTDGSKIKFMKPICIKEEQQQKPEKAKDGLVKLIQHEDKNSHGHDSQGVAPRMALYAPVITFGYCDALQQETLHEKHRELNEMYQGSILHGPRSLDRFYYNALSQEKMDERDRSQVVTRGLLEAISSPGGIVPEKITKWPYLTVDQLWIWVIDKDTIITSSTHREDGFDNLLVNRIFDQLRQGSSKRSGQETPTSAIEMTQFLISSCVDFIGKLTWEDVCHDDDSQIRKDAKSKPVLLLFAEKLNEAMASEKDLFQKFRKRVKVEKTRSKTKKPTHQVPQQDEASRDTTNDDTGEVELRPEEACENTTNDWDAVYSAAELLDEVKDIRDELVILRFLVTQQEHVWTELMGTHPDSYDARSPRFTGEELDDMIKKTETIQTSVKELLNLEENSIGIKESEQLVTLAKRADQQSEENARQERILMLFTFVTIVFTPLSFMASYYALNTSTSRHNNDGELEYEPRWMNQRIFGTSAGIVGPLLFYASFGAILRIPARIRWLLKNKSEIWKLMKTEGLIYAIKAASKVRQYFRSESGEDFVLKIEEGRYKFTGSEDVAAHHKVQVCRSQD